MHPILFYLGPLPVRAYGTLILIGFLVALRYVTLAARKRSRQTQPAPQVEITADHVLDMSLVGLIAGIVGTRIVYVALNWHLFSTNPLDALKLWTGGLSFIGAPVFGFGYAWWYCRRHKLPFLAVADLGAPGFALAYAFGRIGCLLNGCCYGHACSLPWAMRFHDDGAPNVWTDPSHPTQIYSAVMSLVIFAALHRLLNRPHRDGTVFVAYLALYAVYRFVNDFCRSGATAKVVWLGLTDGQCAAIIALPVLIFAFGRVSRKRAGA